jgi:hypothetical protein
MRIRLLKKWRHWVKGTTLEVADPKAKELIRDNIAEKYSGEYPPKKKMKTDFFKPKNVEGNGKG